MRYIYSNVPLHEPSSDPLKQTFINFDGEYATHPTQDSSISKYFKGFRSRFRATPAVRSMDPILDTQRLYKSPQEAKLMRESGKIAGRAFQKSIQKTSSILSEQQLWATLDFEMRMQGADRMSYVPVVAGGENSLTLHYVNNNHSLPKDKLVLVDAGAEYGHYASDITRTWPINGTFSPAQRKLYQVVLSVQKKVINASLIGTSLNALQDMTFSLLKEGVSKLFNRHLSNSEMHILYPHHVGHYLGMDVHDTPSISRNIPLAKDMAITIGRKFNSRTWPIYSKIRKVSKRLSRYRDKD